MNTLIGRVVVYVNTCLKKDINYNIANYIVEHYQNCEAISLKLLCEECYVSRASIIRFCELFGFTSWKAFHQFLIRTKKIKDNQMKERFEKIDIRRMYNIIGYIVNDVSEENKIKKDVQTVVEAIYHSDKIYLFGAIYPLSIMTAFQIDMLANGKVVYSDYQSENSTIVSMNKDDLAIILTATGRYITECKGKFNMICHFPVKRLLLSNNKQYERLQSIYQYIHVELAKCGSIKDYDYYIMAFFDAVSVEYQRQYRQEKSYETS